MWPDIYDREEYTTSRDPWQTDLTGPRFQPMCLAKVPESTRQVGTPNDMVPIRWILVKHKAFRDPTNLVLSGTLVCLGHVGTHIRICDEALVKQSARETLTTRRFVRWPTRCDRACRHTQVYVHVRNQPHHINHKNDSGDLPVKNQSLPNRTNLTSQKDTTTRGS